MTVTLVLPEAVIDQIVERAAERAAARVEGQQEAFRPWLTAREAAEYLRISRSQIHKLVRLGPVISTQYSGKLMLRRDELDGWLCASERQSY